MCGIFGIMSLNKINKEHLQTLALHSRQRGIDKSALVYYNENNYKITKSEYNIMKIIEREKWSDSSIAFGHSLTINNGLSGDQPVFRDGMIVINSGLIVNDDIWKLLNIDKRAQIDSEIIIDIALKHIEEGKDLVDLPKQILSVCEGMVSAILAIPKLGKMLLISNNGSLFVGQNQGSIYFASERYPLGKIECNNIRQIYKEGMVINIPECDSIIITDDKKKKVNNKVHIFKNIAQEEEMLQYYKPNIKRCTKCILPETMPFISFDSKGVCNYCNNYKQRNSLKPKEELFKLVEPYRRNGQADCIVPFSGGRDSCYGLHIIVNELNMKPITYTYDWGMVTDLGYRNISKMCGELGVENITVAANITKKRKNIEKNLRAWLKSPHLGMLSILTSGDKHFFKYVETVKKQTGINLNLWGVNPLEVTHFKSGFLGIKPNFEEKKVYASGFYNQLRYQFLRFKTMLESPDYFNDSIYDTLSGEYYRSFAKKSDYYHIFDYWLWDEKTVDETLGCYGWELALDTNTTWRIGDATAAFYNYVYYTVAGFTEHDTFRSNQIREGQITREEALNLVMDENRPRYQNIRWYLDTLNMDYVEVINVINSIPKLYSNYL